MPDSYLFLQTNSGQGSDKTFMGEVACVELRERGRDVPERIVDCKTWKYHFKLKTSEEAVT